MKYQELPSLFVELAGHLVDSVLLETSRFDEQNKYSLLFLKPVEVLQVQSGDDLENLFTKIEEYLQRGYFVSGYFSYECGYHFQQVHHKYVSDKTHPLAWLGVYEEPLVFNHQTGAITGRIEKQNLDIQSASLSGSPEISKVKYSFDENTYRDKVRKIHEYIAAGDTYQINLTGKYSFNFAGAPVSFYQNLKKKQRVSYSSFLHTSELDILSFSPELFFRIEGNQIITRPMKGTGPRGRNVSEDNQNIRKLRESRKDQAENVMIVDLLRNDLGRICRVGTVHVPELFTVEKYQSIVQMTSAVEGTLTDDWTYCRIFQSLFPSGSVTGAPKLRSMQIIRELELEPRYVYTGAIGYFAPKKLPKELQGQVSDACFNIPIRTLTLSEGYGEMGIGSGIIADSTAALEYQECKLKAGFLLSRAPAEFNLIESILWDKGYQHLQRHLARMENSAKYFDYEIDRQAIEEALKKAENPLEPEKKYKVRLELARDGHMKLESSQVPIIPENILEVVVSSQRTDSHDIFLYHKTTNRQHYNDEYARAIANRYTECLFLNERGEVTEGAISNIFIRNGEEWLTPQVECGLLGGIYRQIILEQNPHAKEGVLSLQDVLQADEVYICNAIRGLRKVKVLVPSLEPA